MAGKWTLIEDAFPIEHGGYSIAIVYQRATFIVNPTFSGRYGLELGVQKREGGWSRWFGHHPPNCNRYQIHKFMSLCSIQYTLEN